MNRYRWLRRMDSIPLRRCKGRRSPTTYLHPDPVGRTGIGSSCRKKENYCVRLSQGYRFRFALERCLIRPHPQVWTPPPLLTTPTHDEVIPAPLMEDAAKCPSI